MGHSFIDEDVERCPVPQKVLILGAGPVGSALAQILRKNGVAFEIFDRDAEVDSRRGGSFLLDDCLPHLLAALPTDMTDISTVSSNSGVGEADTMVYIDGVRSALGRTQGHVERGNPGFAMCARRADFRSWMCQRLNVKFGKRLVNYVEDADGVTVHFTDGSSYRGTILVGADGARSVVRDQLLDQPTREVNRHLPVCGSLRLSRAQYTPLRRLASAMIVANSPECHVMVAQLDIEPDGSSARYWWLCSAVAGTSRKEYDSTHAIGNDNDVDEKTLSELEADWITRTATRQQLFRRALESCKNLPEVVVDPIRRTGPEGIWDPQIRFSEFVPPESLPRGRVTLMGDAAHNAAPFGGRGVNCGLRDAVDLGRLLAEKVQYSSTISSSDSRTDEVAKLLKSYEAIMIPRGRNVVLDARVKAECKHLLGGKKPPQLPPGFKFPESPVMFERASWEKSEHALAAIEARA